MRPPRAHRVTSNISLRRTSLLIACLVAAALCGTASGYADGLASWCPLTGFSATPHRASTTCAGYPATTAWSNCQVSGATLLAGGEGGGRALDSGCMQLPTGMASRLLHEAIQHAASQLHLPCTTKGCLTRSEVCNRPGKSQSYT